MCESVAKQNIDDKQYLPINCLSEITRQESLCDKIRNFFSLFSCCKCFKRINHEDYENNSDNNSDTSNNSRESVTNIELPGQKLNDDEEKV